MLTLRRAGQDAWEFANADGWYQSDSLTSQRYFGRIAIRIEPTAGGYFRADTFFGRIGVFCRDRPTMERSAACAFRAELVEMLSQVDEFLALHGKISGADDSPNGAAAHGDHVLF